MTKAGSYIRHSSFVTRHSKRIHMRILYVEPYSGISGDMMVAALLELGGDLADLQRQLALLPLERYELSLRKCSRAGIQATKFDVRVEERDSHSHAHPHSHEGHTHRSFQDIRQMILGSGLSAWVREKSVEAFARLAEAEGRIHDRPADQ